jgi:hypothetical protein
VFTEDVADDGPEDMPPLTCGSVVAPLRDPVVSRPTQKSAVPRFRDSDRVTHGQAAQSLCPWG